MCLHSASLILCLLFGKVLAMAWWFMKVPAQDEGLQAYKVEEGGNQGDLTYLLFPLHFYFSL